MRHLKSGRKLNRTAAHRRALFRNLAVALIRRESIRTTDAKAKELRSVADRMVTLAKQGTLHARRRAFDRLRDRAAVTKLFNEIGPRFEGRPGGYTRITKVGARPGDAAPLSVIAWTTGAEEAQQAGKPSKKGGRKGKAESGVGADAPKRSRKKAATG